MRLTLDIVKCTQVRNTNPVYSLGSSTPAFVEYGPTTTTLTLMTPKGGTLQVQVSEGDMAMLTSAFGEDNLKSSGTLPTTRFEREDPL